MLAQNFQTPAALGLSDVEFESLVKVLGMLEREEIRDEQLDMAKLWPCGTAFCLCGWSYEISGGRAFPEAGTQSDAVVGMQLYPRLPDQLQDLFMVASKWSHLRAATTSAQAAIATRNYLTHGEPRWAEALAA